MNDQGDKMNDLKKLTEIAEEQEKNGYYVHFSTKESHKESHKDGNWEFLCEDNIWHDGNSETFMSGFLYRCKKAVEAPEKIEIKIEWGEYAYVIYNDKTIESRHKADIGLELYYNGTEYRLTKFKYTKKWDNKFSFWDNCKATHAIFEKVKEEEK